MPGRRQLCGTQAHAVRIGDLERPTHEGGVKRDAALREQIRDGGIRTDEEVLAVIERMRIAVQFEHKPARTAAELTARFEQDRLVSRPSAGRRGRTPGPAASDHTDAQSCCHVETQVFHAIHSLRSGVSAMR